MITGTAWKGRGKKQQDEQYT